MTTPNVRTPLVVLGLDAGDPRFIQTWAAQGHLPTLARLMREGCWGLTTGPELVSEHGVWISLFSGISRAQHGYYYFRQLKPGTYDLQAVRGVDIAAPPFWAALAGSSEKQAVIIDPPDGEILTGLPGLQLINWATHNNWDPSCYAAAGSPDTLLAEIRRRFGPPLVTVENHRSTYDEDLRLYREIMARVPRKGEVCRELFGRAPFDLYLTVFAESHVANHQFWSWCPEVAANAGQPVKELTHAIRDVYQAIDREMGRILDALPRPANVVVVSSVGMEDDYPVTGLSDLFFRTCGFQSTPPRAFSLHPIALARRMIPRSLRVGLSRRLTRERREQILAEEFRHGTDWTRTRVFALPSAYTTFVRVNLRGREPMGTVAPDGDYEAALDSVEEELSQLVEPQSGEPAVVRMTRASRAFGGGPPDVLPDLFVDWRPGRFLRRVRHPRYELTQERPDFYRRSDHSAEGFFLAAGPDVRARGRLEEVEVLDIAPTLCRLLGELGPVRFRGRALSSVAGGAS